MRLPEVDKPVYKMTDEELMALVDELEVIEWASFEQRIDSLVESAAETWERNRQDSQNHFLSGFNVVRPAQHLTPSMMTANYVGLRPPLGPFAFQTTTIKVNLPPWLKSEMVRPLAEAQIREQIEQIEENYE